MRISDWRSDVCSSDLPVRTVADLAGVKQLRGRTLTEAVEDRDRDERDQEEAAWIRAANTKAVDLFRSRLSWLPVENGFCLPAGESTIVLAPVGEGWAVVSVGRRDRKSAVEGKSGSVRVDLGGGRYI